MLPKQPLFTLIGFVAASLLIASSAQAQLIFSDNFEADTQTLGVTALTNWTASSGTVDVIGAGGPYDFYPGNGNYLDLDGTPAGGATLVSSSFALAPGSYSLSFLLGKNGGASESMVVSVGPIGTPVFSTTIADNGGYPTFVSQVFNFTVATGTTGSIVFNQAGADAQGYVIDNVQLSVVPEPGTLALLAVGLTGGLAFRRRKTTST